MDDFKTVAQSALQSAESLLCGWLPGGKRRANEYLALNPMRADSSLGSFTVNLKTGKWADFAADARGGDLISLLAYIRHNGDQAAALHALAAEIGQGISDRRAPVCTEAKPRKSRSEVTVLRYAPHGTPEPDAVIPELGTPVSRWCYRDADGLMLGWVFRYERDGKKEFRQMAWGREQDGREQWVWKAMTTPRPLYGLDLLSARPDAPVLIVEGEKAADSARRMLPEFVTVTWPGGAGGVGNADFSPLATRTVAVWPDNDEPGVKAAARIKRELPRARIIAPPKDKPAGWDAADAEAEGFDANALLYPQATAAAAPADPFACLGYRDGEFHFLPAGNRQVISISAGAMDARRLVQLAPLEYWRDRYIAEGQNWAIAAASDLMAACHAAGLWDDDKLRGRGCWIDDGRIVLHAGDHLMVDNARVEIGAISSRYCYPAARKLDWEGAPPATKQDAARLLDLCKMLPISERDAIMFAGWIALAPICGVLPWRPHLWLTGPSGAGKSWIIDNVMKPLIGSSAIVSSVSSTEAGIRQELGIDSLPVIYDEAESEERHAQEAIQRILNLARASSSDGASRIIKGTAGGSAMGFTIRSMFAFSSITPGAAQKPDRNRMVIIEVRKRDDMEAFRRLKDFARQTSLVKPWCASIRSRMLSMSRVIQDNYGTLSNAITAIVGSRRTGDKLGAVVAGALALSMDGTLTEEKALAWCREKPHYWRQEEDADADDDSQAALGIILDAIIDGPDARESVAGLILRCNDVADACLANHGLKRVGRSELAIAYGSDPVKRMFERSIYGRGFASQLRRIPGCKSAVLRVNGRSQRCLVAPHGCQFADQE